LNRTAELTANFRFAGNISFFGRSIYDDKPKDVRRHIGLVYQTPVPCHYRYGQIIEKDITSIMFDNPSHEATRSFFSGAIG
jgi:ABC-type phosphate transport system ATPase subunit